MAWNRWHWLEDGILPLLVVLMRVCWIWPWLQMLQRWLTPTYGQHFLSIWAIIALFLGGALTARISLQRAPSLARARLWAAAIGIGATLGLLWWHYGRALYPLWDPHWLASLARALAYWGDEVSPPFITFVVAAAVWLRGLLDGRAPITHEQVWAVFKLGSGALVLLLLAGRMDPGGLPPGTERWIILFFAAGMAALALSSLEISRHGRRPQGESQLSVNRFWLSSVLSVVIILLVLGLLIGALISPDALARAIGWVGTILSYVGIVIGYLLLAVAYVLFLLLTPLINWLQGRFGAALQIEPPQLQNMQEQSEQLQQSGTEVPVALIESSRWLGVAGMFILVVVLFAFALRYFRSQRDESAAETRETILSRDLLRDQLSSLWRDWRARFRARSLGKQSPFLSLMGVESHRQTIRALYQQLLSSAKELGVPRPKIETPAEYQQTLEAALPADHVALETMTVAYTEARYGPDAPSAAAVDNVRSAWEALRPTLILPQQADEDQQESNAE